MIAKRLLLLVLLLTLAACGGDDTPVAPAGDDDPVILPSDADGMLLPGEPDEAAVVPVTLLPTAAASEHIGEGLLLSRLAAVIHPDATVADVNASLELHDAAIISMVEGSPLVSVVIPPVADRAEAENLAASLKATPGFVSVWPSVAAAPLPPIEVPTDAVEKHPPHADALNYALHTIWSRLPISWSLRKAAAYDARIILPYWFPAGGDVNEIPNFAREYGTGRYVPESDGIFHARAAEGHHLAGVAGANWNFETWEWHTGIDPMNELLDLRGMSTYGQSITEQMTDLALLQPSGRTVVLSVQPYAPDFEDTPHLQRVYDALHWRRLLAVLAGGETDWVHVVSAGRPNDELGGMDWNSPYLLAETQDLRTYAALFGNEEEFAAFQVAYDQIVSIEPGVANPPGNVLAVGSSDPFGDESAFSAPGSDVRFMGEEVKGPCSVPAWCDDGESGVVSGTAVAAAQAAGLIAYMWHINHELTAQDMITRVHHGMITTSVPGLVDGLITALSVDAGVGLQSSPARFALMDLDENARFDEADLASFLDAFENLQGEDGHFTRWDLNGDGNTGGENRVKFDLDANTLPSFTTVTQGAETTTNSYDELGLTDLEILCYYAYSPLYQGDPAVRRELLADCAGPGAAILFDRVQREVSASARGGGASSIRAQEFESRGSLTETFAADTSSVSGSYRAHGSATINHQSSLTFDDFENFTGLTLGSSASASYDGTWGDAKADNWIASGVAGDWIMIDFTVEGGAVPYTMDLDFNSVLTDTLTRISVFAELWGDEEGTIFVYDEDELAADAFQPHGTLQPDLYELRIRIDLIAEANDGVHAIPSGSILDGGGTANWGLIFTLRP